MADHSVLAVAGRPRFIVLPGVVGVLLVWQLASHRVNDSKTSRQAVPF